MLLRAPRPELKREIMTFWRTYSGCLNTWFRGQGAMTSPRCYGGDFRGQGRFLLVTKKRCRCHIWNRSQRVHLLSVSCLHTQTYKHIHKEKTNSYTVMTNSTSLTIHCTDSQPGVLVQFIWKKKKMYPLIINIHCYDSVKYHPLNNYFRHKGCKPLKKCTIQANNTCKS